MILSSFSLNSKAEMKEEYIEYIEEVSSDYNICPELIESIIFYESSWNEKAYNSKYGCKGLGQINQNVHKDRMKALGVTDLYDPYGNILVMCDYLSELFIQYEEVETVLMIYNEGNNGLKRANKGIVSNYCKRVLDLSEELERESIGIEDGFIGDWIINQ